MNIAIPNRRSYAAYVDDRPDDGVFRIDRAIYNDPAILEEIGGALKGRGVGT